jgi:hypothetical protein
MTYPPHKVHVESVQIDKSSVIDYYEKLKFERRATNFFNGCFFLFKHRKMLPGRIFEWQTTRQISL